MTVQKVPMLLVCSVNPIHESSVQLNLPNMIGGSSTHLIGEREFTVQVCGEVH